MYDRILGYGLQKQRKHLVFGGFKSVGDHDAVADPVSEPHLLNLEINIQMLQLLLKSCIARSRIFQHIAHGLSEKLGRVRHLRITRSQRLHPDRFKRIVEEVRIDLA